MGSAARKGDWLQLVLNVPGTDRDMPEELWSALESLGCIGLSDGVYVLPARPPLEARAREITHLADSLGAQAWMFHSNAVDLAEELALQELFGRDSEYGTWLEDVFQLQLQLTQLPLHEVMGQCRRLSRELGLLRAIDYFPNEISREASRAWEQLFAQVQETERAPMSWASPEASSSSQGSTPLDSHRLLMGAANTTQ